MQIVRTIAETRQISSNLRSQGSLGLVPTMGALHEGHLSLIRRARSENGSVAATIFVNPLQFAANEDLDKYPRTFEDDCEKLQAEGVSFLFAPTSAEMYPEGASTTIDPGPVGMRLDGASRPGHFVGVATVVAKIFNVVQPDRAYFGQKDAAQLAVLKKMAGDLNLPVELVACPIVRDGDGLALSSRNRYLSAAERRDALGLPRLLEFLRGCIEAGERRSGVLLSAGLQRLSRQPGLMVDYLAIVDAETLLPRDEAMPGSLIAVAAKAGSTRLIDNCLAP